MSRPGALVVASLFLFAAGGRAGTTLLNQDDDGACQTTQRIAVVGGGIGSAAFSFHLKEFLPKGQCAEVHVFEQRDYVGGRLKHTQFGNMTLELGGDAWSSVNLYMMNMAKTLGIDIDSGDRGDSDTTTSMGVWDGSQFSGLKTTMLKHLLSVGSLAASEAAFIARLRYNYLARDKLKSNKPFTSVAEFLRIGSLDQYVKVSSKEFFAKKKISQAVQTDGIEPLLRDIYDQDLNAHVFSCLVAMTATINAYSVTDGNAELVKKALEYSNAKVHLETSVKQIKRDGSGFVLSTVNAKNKTVEFAADKVVIATPLEFANLDLPPLDRPVVPREFVHCYVTMIQARGVNPAYFGMPSTTQIPDVIYTTQSTSSDLPWHVVAMQEELDGGVKLYKIFSNEDVSDVLPSLFLGLDTYVVQYWPYTFPKLIPVDSRDHEEVFQPLVLAPDLYYLNAMESVASAMEGSSIAGRNAALLITKKSL